MIVDVFPVLSGLFVRQNKEGKKEKRYTHGSNAFTKRVSCVPDNDCFYWLFRNSFDLVVWMVVSVLLNHLETLQSLGLDLLLTASHM